MLIKIIIVILSSIICSVLYYFGGETNYNTKIRDIGCPVISCGLVAWHFYPLTPMGWTWLIISFLCSFGSMTTYWKGDKVDVKWYHWLITGMIYSLAMLPFCWFMGLWVQLIIRTIILAIIIMFWSEKIDDVFLEAGGRGFWYCITTPILFI